MYDDDNDQITNTGSAGYTSDTPDSDSDDMMGLTDDRAGSTTENETNDRFEDEDM